LWWYTHTPSGISRATKPSAPRPGADAGRGTENGNIARLSTIYPTFRSNYPIGNGATKVGWSGVAGDNRHQMSMLARPENYDCDGKWRRGASIAEF
jgi:hypothetical protein